MFFVGVHPPWLAKANFKLTQLNTHETHFKRGLNSCFMWEEVGSVGATHQFPAWLVGLWKGWGFSHLPGSAVTHPRALDLVLSLLSSPAKGGSAPAASGPPAWPQEALEVQNKINSFNPSNFPQSRSAGSRPVFCGLQWASVSVPECLCLMTVSQSHVPVFFCAHKQHLKAITQRTKIISHGFSGAAPDPRAPCPGYQHSGTPGHLAAESTPSHL